MGDYEANARMDRAVNALADLKAAVEKKSVDIEQSIEWSTGEITRSIDGLTEALTSPRRQAVPGLFRAVRLWISRRQERRPT